MDADYIYNLDMPVWNGLGSQLHVGYVLDKDAKVCPHVIAGRIPKALVVLGPVPQAICLACLLVSLQTIGRPIA